MRRQRRSIEVRLRAADVVTAGQALKRHAKAAGSAPRLRMRVRDDGRVRARAVEFSRYNTPPVLVGRITPAPGGGILAATIRESYVEVLMPRLFVGLALFMAVMCGALLVAGEFTNLGVYVCGIGGTVFGLIGYALGRLRRSSFHHHADRLERAVRAAAQG
jgi:hypothetical protein